MRDYKDDIQIIAEQLAVEVYDKHYFDLEDEIRLMLYEVASMQYFERMAV